MTLSLGDYRSVVVLTGAGVSVASGLPTYRGAGGLWSTDELARLSDAEALAREPERVIRFFSGLRPRVLAAAPNAAHLALARAEAARPAGTRFTLVTQNVDGLHQRAGSQDVLELHGSIFRSRCTRCAAPPFPDERDPPEGPLPTCGCGALVRPDVTLFGEALPAAAEHGAKRALRDCDLFLAVGTSGSVWPAAGFVRAAAYAGARCVYVNLEPIEGEAGFHEQHLGPAEALLPALLG